MWEPALASALAIFLTISFFAVAYISALFIVKAGLYVVRKIKDEFNKEKQE